MSKMPNTSPTRFTGEVDHFYDPNYSAEISQKMRVPKRINVDGVSDMPNVSRPESHWMPAESLDMFVPERIVVADELDLDCNGSDGALYGTKGIPREITLDNTIMPPDPGFVRVRTPPRVLTIDSHFTPDGYQSVPSPPKVEKPVRRTVPAIENRIDVMNSSINETSMSEGMTVNEEVVHLRKQLAKLNRRVMSIELENLQRQNREKIVYAIGLAYFFFKTVIWLSRS